MFFFERQIIRCFHFVVCASNNVAAIGEPRFFGLQQPLMYRSGARLPTNCDIIIHGAHLATLKYFLVKDKFPTASSKRFNYVIYNYGHNVSGSKYYMAAERENSLRKPRLMPALSIADWTWIERARIICFKEVVNIGITIWSLLGSLMIRVLRTERR